MEHIVQMDCPSDGSGEQMGRHWFSWQIPPTCFRYRILVFKIERCDFLSTFFHFLGNFLYHPIHIISLIIHVIVILFIVIIRYYWSKQWDDCPVMEGNCTTSCATSHFWGQKIICLGSLCSLGANGMEKMFR